MMTAVNFKEIREWAAKMYRDLVDRQYEDHWIYEGDEASVSNDERLAIKEAVIENTTYHFGLKASQSNKLRKYVEGL